MKVRLYFAWIDARAREVADHLADVVDLPIAIRPPSRTAGLSDREISNELSGSGTMSSEMPNDSTRSLSRVSPSTDQASSSFARRQACCRCCSRRSRRMRAGSRRSRRAACRLSSAPSLRVGGGRLGRRGQLLGYNRFSEGGRPRRARGQTDEVSRFILLSGGLCPRGPPYALTRGAPTPHSVRAARSLPLARTSIKKGGQR